MAKDYRVWCRWVATVALAGLFGGPIAGLANASGQAVELLFADEKPGAPKSLRALRGRIEEGLVAFAHSEHLSDESVEQALHNAQELLARHSLGAADLVGLDLDPSRASAELRRRCRAELADMEEEVSTLCSMILNSVMASIAQDSAALPDLQYEFQRAVLARLSALDSPTDSVDRALIRMGAGAMIAGASWPWRREEYPPSALLRANYAVVPFYGRDQSLDQMADWSVDHHRASLTVCTGAGGMGKTRLMLQACRRLRAAGWNAGFLHSRVSAVTPEQLDILTEGVQGLFVVVDYAETRRAMTASLLEAAVRTNGRVRIVLLARSLGDWWLELRHSAGRVGDFVSGPATRREEIAPLALDLAERRQVHREAALAFASALQPQPPDEQLAVDLAMPLYDRALFIHLNALAHVLGEPAQTQAGLLDFALRREREFLNAGVRGADMPQLAGRPIFQAAALVTMVGGADSLPSTLRLLDQVPLLAGQTAAAMSRIARLLHELYPADTWLAGVQPDLLGEHLVANAIDEDPMLLGAFVSNG